MLFGLLGFGGPVLAVVLNGFAALGDGVLIGAAVALKAGQGFLMLVGPMEGLSSAAKIAASRSMTVRMERCRTQSEGDKFVDHVLFEVALGLIGFEPGEFEVFEVGQIFAGQRDVLVAQQPCWTAL